MLRCRRLGRCGLWSTARCGCGAASVDRGRSLLAARDRVRPNDEVLALTIPERETIIRALDDAPDGLEELRAVLLREHVGRIRDGLV